MDGIRKSGVYGSLRASATPLQIVIDRWSSDAERDRLMVVLLSQVKSEELS